MYKVLSKGALVLTIPALAACGTLAATPKSSPTRTAAPGSMSIYFVLRDHTTLDSPPLPPYHLFALNTSDGTVRWSRPGSNPTASGIGELRPVFDQGALYIGDQGISAINATTGKTLWHYQADGTKTVQAVANGVIYATEIDSFNGELYALEASSGKLLWRSATISNLRTFIINVMGNLIYASGPNTPSSLTAYSVTNGAQLWRYQADGNNLLYFLQADNDQTYALVSTLGLEGFLTVLNSRDGSLRWRFPQTGQGNIEVEGIAQQLVYAASLDERSFYALKTTDGSVQWQAQVGMVASASLDGALLYLTSSTGTIYALSANNGTIKWQGQAGHPQQDFDTRGPGIQQNLLYVSRTQDGIYALNTGDGSTTWHSATGALAQGIDFNVLGTSTGVVYVDAFNNNTPNGDTLLALNSSNGATRWSYHVAGSSADSGFIMG